MTTWRELKALGVERCCVVFVSGKRCRRRAANQEKGGCCARCEAKYERMVAPYRKMLREAEAEMRRPEPEEEDEE